MDVNEHCLISKDYTKFWKWGQKAVTLVLFDRSDKAKIRKDRLEMGNVARSNHLNLNIDLSRELSWASE
jgi:hypothetical protein